MLKIVQFMEYLAVITALNHLGSFGKNFVKLKKKINKNFIHQLIGFILGKTVPFILSTQDFRHSFSWYRPPCWWITYLLHLQFKLHDYITIVQPTTSIWCKNMHRYLLDFICFKINKNKQPSGWCGMFILVLWHDFMNRHVPFL